MSVRFSDLVMAPPDIYPAAIRDSERHRFFVPCYQPIGSERTGLAYRPGVLAIDTTARDAYFFDLEDYEGRRDRPGAIRVLSRIVLAGFAIFVALLVFPPPSHASEERAYMHAGIAFAALVLALICSPFLLRVWLAARRDREMAHATRVEVPKWLIDWLAPLWDRVERSLSCARGEASQGQSSETADDADKARPFGDAFWKSFLEETATSILGELGGAAAGAGADAALDRRGRAGERLAHLIRRHAAWRILRLHERAFGRKLVRVKRSEWSAGLDFTDDRFTRPAGGAISEPGGGAGK